MSRLLYVVTHGISARNLLKGQLRWMRERGHTVAVAAAAGPDLDAAGDAEGVETMGVPLEREIAPLADLRALVELVRAMRQWAPDVVLASTPKAALLGTTAAWIARIPGRLTLARGLRLETATGRTRALLGLTERISTRLATDVLAVSPSLARRMEALKLVRPGRMQVLGEGSSNGVRAERFASSATAPNDARAALSIPAEAPVIGFVGRFTRDKGIPELVVAVERLRMRFPDLRLLLVGEYETGDPVPDATRAVLDTDPLVVRPGFVNDPAPLYAAMDVLAFPSYREGFPNVPLEAAASGLPVVGFRATGTVDAIQDGVTGTLVNLGDVDGLTDALCRYIEDPALREQHGRAGRLRATEAFAPEVIWTALAERVEQIAARTRPRPVTDAVTRVVDVFGAAVGLTLLGPVIVGTAVQVARKLGRPVFFRQVRPGMHGRPFEMIKFRTMTDARDSDGELLPDVERLTPFGQFLRSSSLDELPELWNVLKGDMSLVGPRPLLMRYLDRYTPEQARRHDVRPGITGLAQVSGRNAISWDEKFTLDVQYVDQRSLGLNLKILAQTVLKVIRRDDIAAPGEATMPEFVSPSLSPPQHD